MAFEISPTPNNSMTTQGNISISPTNPRLCICRDVLKQAMSDMANSPRRNFNARRRHNMQASSVDVLTKISFIPSESIKDALEHLSLRLDGKFAGLMSEVLLRIKEIDEKEALLMIGKVLFLIDRRATFHHFTLKTDLERLFNEHMGLMALNLKRCKSVQEQKLSLSLFLAESLITEVGRLNLGLVDPLIAFFKEVNQTDSGYANSVTSFIELLQTTSDLRQSLESIPHPKKTNDVGRMIIQASLKLPKGVKIHSYHAKRTALMACLSYPRQEDAANCFAVSAAVSLFSNKIDHCISDFRELLEYGSLIRKVNNRSYKFPALLKLPLFNFGTTENDVWTSYDSLKNLFYLAGMDTPEGIDNLSPIEFINYLKKHELNDLLLIHGAYYRNPLLIVWINTLAAMAEGKPDSVIKSAILESCAIAFKEQGASEVELSKIRKRMIKQMYLHYDPTVQPFKEGEEGGAFVLYSKSKIKHTPYTPVDTSEKFKSFLFDVARATNVVYWTMAPYAVPHIVGIYSEGEDLSDEAIKNIDSLKKTPWKTMLGNDLNSLMAVYENRPTIDPVITFEPTSNVDLFIRLQAFWKERTEEDKASETLNRKGSYVLIDKNLIKHKRPHSSIHIPAKIVSFHSFNLILNDSNFYDFIVADPQQVLREREIQAIHISNQLVPHELCNEVEKHLLSNFPQVKHRILALPKTCTLYEYRQKLCELLKKEYVDNMLFKYLPKSIKEEMEKNFILFGDSNHEVEGSDLHMVFCFSPLSKSLEIFQAKDNGELLSPLTYKDQQSLGKWEISSPPDTRRSDN